MSENERELISIIRENDTPIAAMMTAATIILGYLQQLESSEAQASAGLQVSC